MCRQQPVACDEEAQKKNAQEEGGVWRAGDMGDCKERCMTEGTAY